MRCAKGFQPKRDIGHFPEPLPKDSNNNPEWCWILSVVIKRWYPSAAPSLSRQNCHYFCFHILKLCWEKSALLHMALRNLLHQPNACKAKAINKSNITAQAFSMNLFCCSHSS